MRTFAITVLMFSIGLFGSERANAQSEFFPSYIWGSYLAGDYGDLPTGVADCTNACRANSENSPSGGALIVVGQSFGHLRYQPLAPQYPPRPNAFVSVLPKTGEGGPSAILNLFIGGTFASGASAVAVAEGGGQPHSVAYVVGFGNSNDFGTGGPAPTFALDFSANRMGCESHGFAYLAAIEPRAANGIGLRCFAQEGLSNATSIALTEHPGTGERLIAVGGYFDGASAHNFPSTDGTSVGGHFDGFLTIFDEGLGIVANTYIGGADYDAIAGIEAFESVGGERCIAVVGTTESTDLPIQFRSTVAVENFGDVSSGQKDAMVGVYCLDNNANLQKQWLRYFGGSDDDVALDVGVTRGRLPSGGLVDVLFVGGGSDSEPLVPFLDGGLEDIPNGGRHNPSPGRYSGFIATFFDADPSQMSYRSFLGGSEDDWITSIATRGPIVAVTGTTFSQDFPIRFPTSNTGVILPPPHYDTSWGVSDIFVATLNSDIVLRLDASSYVGGYHEEFAGASRMPWPTGSAPRGHGMTMKAGHLNLVGTTKSADVTQCIVGHPWSLPSLQPLHFDELFGPANPGNDGLITRWLLLEHTGEGLQPPDFGAGDGGTGIPVLPLSPIE